MRKANLAILLPACKDCIGLVPAGCGEQRLEDILTELGEKPTSLEERYGPKTCTQLILVFKRAVPELVDFSILNMHEERRPCALMQCGV